MLSGFLPFFDENVPKLVKQITDETPDFSESKFHDVCPTARDLIKRMLNKDPLERPSIEECLKSQWFDETHSSEKSGCALDRTSSCFVDLYQLKLKGKQSVVWGAKVADLYNDMLLNGLDLSC